MRRIAITAVIGACMALWAAGPAAADGTTECTGVFTGAAINVVVPDGAHCILEGAQIKNNVLVGTDATLTTFGGNGRTVIGNNVVAPDAHQVLLFYETQVGGNVHISGTAPYTLNGIDINGTVGGNFEYMNNDGYLFIDAAQIGGSVLSYNNSAIGEISNDQIGKNLFCRNDPPYIEFNNTVGGQTDCPAL
jgi:hypothetical protein